MGQRSRERGKPAEGTPRKVLTDIHVCGETEWDQLFTTLVMNGGGMAMSAAVLSQVLCKLTR